MLKNVCSNYNHTIYASYIGYISQAIVNNFAPLLFLTLASSYGLTLEQITFITTANFLVQLCVDLLSAKFIDRIGYRVGIMAAHFLVGAGLIGLAVLPQLTADPYTGLMAAVVLYATGGGLIEVLISPLVEACPTKRKEAAMSLLHSFYCWGHVAVVLLSTAFFMAFGVQNWRVLACLWAIVPILNILYFSWVPLYSIVSEAGKEIPIRDLLRKKAFWLLTLLMICAGASELAMSQWTSAFAESALQVTKTVGDLAGPCAFALLMGTARALYGKFSGRLPLKTAILGSAALCTGCYALAVFAESPALGLLGCAVCGFSVGVFWPGTYSIAAKELPNGGTAMYALLALAGDIGCSAGPAVTGLTANAMGGQLKAGLLAAIVFPVLMLLGASRIKH